MICTGLQLWANKTANSTSPWLGTLFFPIRKMPAQRKYLGRWCAKECKRERDKPLLSEHCVCVDIHEYYVIEIWLSKTALYLNKNPLIMRIDWRCLHFAPIQWFSLRLHRLVLACSSIVWSLAIHRKLHNTHIVVVGSSIVVLPERPTQFLISSLVSYLAQS